MSIEDLIDECGGLGRFQVLIMVGIYLNVFPMAWSMLQMSFAGFIPDWDCVVGPDKRNTSYFNNDTFQECSVNNSYTGYKDQHCESYDFDNEYSTVISEWDLVCDKKWVKATIEAIQMAGVLIGSAAAGQLADTYGRRITIFGFSLFHALLNFGAAFSNSWEMFAAFRFLLGFGVGGVLVVRVPYIMEFVPTKWRPMIPMLPIWASGISLFALAAYLLEDWSYLHIACGVVNLPGIVAYFYVPESVRWLTLKGRYGEAEKIFWKMAIMNGKTPPKYTRSTLEQIYKEEHESRSNGKKYTYWDLFKGRQNVINTLVHSYVWFALSAVYYGISFGVSALSGNLYLNIFLLAIVECPAQFTTFWLNNTLGRKVTAIGLLLIAAVPAGGCLITFFEMDASSRGGWVTGLSLTSKMGIGAGWIVFTTWCGECYPTVVRSLSYGMFNTAARVGGIIAPFVIDFDNAPKRTYLIITAMVVFAILVSFLVPETKGKLLTDSINKPSVPAPSSSTGDNNIGINIPSVLGEESSSDEEGRHREETTQADESVEK